MSWWVYLEVDGDPVEIPRHAEGGTHALAGTTEAELNITYNYSDHYYETIDDDEGLRWLDGKPAGDTTEVLREAVEQLGTEQTDNYWDGTRGNAGHALSILLDWAQQHPEAEWRVS